MLKVFVAKDHPFLSFPSQSGVGRGLLLTCSRSDGAHPVWGPFLTQWVVYAIRNLTEDNSQNQDLIAKMEEQGLADASLLKKMGFEVEKRGDKLILKSTNDTPQL
ncbi:hypothetical protein FD754_013066 [Muntiacus muntjak]|uniref:Ataxin-10 domain-containing protein n=1 Tax=Muntiacus muntjak TaxID=9888 RepID=A0A5N3VG28_MUNMU|nr:hypothetical protein FD754_013066 [Muntiacus muntjak]